MRNVTAELDEDPELSRAVALAREVLHRSGALRVSVALGRDEPAVVECERLKAIVVRDARSARALPHDAADGVALPPLPFMRRLPPFAVDPDTGEVTGVIGGLEMLGRAVRDVAGLLGEPTVVAAEYETTDPHTPLGLAGRRGEPVIVLIGDSEFELDV